MLLIRGSLWSILTEKDENSFKVNENDIALATPELPVVASDHDVEGDEVDNVIT